MKIRSLGLENFRRHRRTDLEFPDGVLTLVGRNGSGKSTVLEALGFALFGVPATRTSKELLRWDLAAPTDPVRVVLEMELAGQAVRIERELRGKNLTPSASMQVDGTTQVAPGGNSNGAVTHAVERMLGMDRDAFFTTVVARQKELSRLADQTPADRKRLLLGMLGVDALDRAIEDARHRHREAVIRVDALREGAPDAKALQVEVQAAQRASSAAVAALDAAKQDRDQAQESVAAARKTWDALDARRQDAERIAAQAESARQEQARLETTHQRLLARQAEMVARAVDVGPQRRIAATLPDLRKAERAAIEAKARDDERGRAEDELRRIEASVASMVPLEDPSKALDALEARLKEIGAQVQAASEAVAVASHEQAGLQKRLHRVAALGDDAPCPVCERPLEGHAGELRRHLDAESKAASERTGRARADLDALTRAQKDLHQQGARLAGQARAREQAVARRKDLDDQATRLRQRITELAPAPRADGADLATLRRRIEEAEAAETAVVRAEEAQRRRKDLDADIADNREAAASLATRLDGLAEQVKQAAHDPEAWKAARQRRDDAEELLRKATTAWSTADSDHRLARQRLAHAEARATEAKRAAERLQEARRQQADWGALARGRGEGLLERFRAHLVARIGPAISHEAGRLLGLFTRGRYREVRLDADYRLYVMDEGTAYTLDRFSGGESDLVHLALRLAVSRLLLERSGGADLRFLALDEVFGSLDSERRGSVIAALHGLGGLYSQVLLVTHEDSLRDALDATLLVEERDGESVVSLHNG